MQHAQNEVLSAEQRWLSVVRKSEFYAELVDGTLSRPVVQVSSSSTSSSLPAKLVACASTIASHVRYVWLNKGFRKLFFKALGMACACLSAMVLWSEATLSFPFNVSPFALFLSPSFACPATLVLQMGVGRCPRPLQPRHSTA